MPVDFDHHDEKLLDYIAAATEKFESDTDCNCIESTFVLYIDEFIRGVPINLIRRPVIDVESITYLSDDGVRETLDPEAYQVSHARRQVSTAYGFEWPNHAVHNESIEITFRVGATSQASVPRLWRQAISLAVGGWFMDPADERPRDPWRTSYDAIIRRFFSVNEI